MRDLRPLVLLLCLVMPISVATASKVEDEFYRLHAQFNDGTSEADLKALELFASRHEQTRWGQYAASIVAQERANLGQHKEALVWSLKVETGKSILGDELLRDRATIAEKAVRLDVARECWEALAESKHSPTRRRALLNLSDALRNTQQSNWREPLKQLVAKEAGSDEALEAEALLILDLLEREEPQKFIRQALDHLLDHPDLPASAFYKLQGRLSSERKAGVWDVKPEQTRALLELQKKLFAKGDTKRLLSIDSIYVTKQLSSEDLRWSEFFWAVGQYQARNRSTAQKTFDRLKDEPEVRQNPALLREVLFYRLRCAFAVDDMAATAAAAKDYFGVKGVGGSPITAYRYLCWSHRERGEDYEHLGKEMLRIFPGTEETTAVYRDLVLDAFEKSDFKRGLALTEEFLDEPRNTDDRDKFLFWKARFLQKLGSTTRAAETLQQLDSYDTYGCFAREMLASLNDGKVEGYLLGGPDEKDVQKLSAGPLAELPEHLQRWALIRGIAATGKDAENLRETWRKLAVDDSWRRFEEAFNHRLTGPIYRQADQLRTSYDDLAVTFLLAMRAGEAGENFLKARYLFITARTAESQGQPIRSPLFWRELFPLTFHEPIAKEATEKSVETLLVHSLIMQESTYQIRSQSGVGARGLMQLMPYTAKQVARSAGLRGFDVSRVYEPETNILLGVTYLQQLLDRFQGNVPLVLAGYNAGPNKAEDWLRRFDISDLPAFIERITYNETRGYVKKILRNRQFYHLLYGKGPYKSILFGDVVVINPKNQ